MLLGLKLNARFTKSASSSRRWSCKVVKGERTEKRVANWSTSDTIKLLTLWFQTEDSVASFFNQRSKGDEKPNWSRWSPG
ncbi:hypothetical protein PF008_g23050 [Phytophthora fragariae]|uniref:Uncharacterized protein n=1 Tax=Phytophthora fragariae TaxID=53985 RepID=A0A6G0QRU9_9STRA|nr:hypothetical protein PF008_g23050 [Phytophthora fragariae]